MEERFCGLSEDVCKISVMWLEVHIKQLVSWENVWESHFTEVVDSYLIWDVSSWNS